ncbi:LysR family transcriptional regulator [Bhargavaea ginsengi]|uniref:LysR family transcriptional regulator n=1 Tax=Bhargavaea ginsengi TaxID=426757 RepID=UPI00203DF9B1|nr:LysR family transcriptional regulator [Bhargavaea ginsengi]MCM3088624.1 LysR family transcriptional regulator [Bhargavaea ginsengi]
MNAVQVETYLMIVRQGNISRAAHHLFVSQSTVSQRLDALEREYGLKLFNREKGAKSISLTEEGERFYPIALKYESLIAEVRSISEIQEGNTVTIGAVDSVHNYIFSDLYTRMMDDLAQIRLGVHTYQSDQIYSLIAGNELDIGFSLQERVMRGVSVTQLFEEQMVLIQPGPEKTPIVKNEDLDASQQLLVNWGAEYRIWHEKYWGPLAHTPIQVDTVKMLRTVMAKRDYWAIVPVSVARALRTVENWSVSLLEDPPPNRVCYFVAKEEISPAAKEVSEVILESGDVIGEIVREWEAY